MVPVTAPAVFVKVCNYTDSSTIEELNRSQTLGPTTAAPPLGCPQKTCFIANSDFCFAGEGGARWHSGPHGDGSSSHRGGEGVPGAGQLSEGVSSMFFCTAGVISPIVDVARVFVCAVSVAQN